MAEATAEQLLASVIANPDDDGPRLVYADFLAERGDPRGEFINAQLRLSGRINPARRRELEERVREIFHANGKTWLADLVGLNGSFRRGFIQQVRGAAKDFANTKTLLQLEPVTTAKLVEGDDAMVIAMIEAGHLARLRHLRIANGTVGNDAMTEIAASGDLASLEILNLANNEIGDDGLDALAGAPHFALRSLTLNNNQIGDDGISALAASPMASSLRSLYLARNQITDRGVRAIVASPHLHNLRHLSLGGNFDITDDGATELAQPEFAARLHRLELDELDLDTGRAALKSAWGDRVRLF